jgi:hypothetical protein
MRKLIGIVAGGLFAAGLLASPSFARRSEPTPAGIWIDLHFKAANGKVHTVVEPLTLYRASQAAEECGNPAHMAVIAKGAYIDNPRLASMQFLGGKCETDARGKIKMAIGAWPAGRGPGYQSEAGLSVKVQPDLLAGAPAVVVLHFIATNGHHVNTVFGYRKKAVFYMRTCAAQLPPLVPRLVAAAQFDRVAIAAPGDAATRPYGLYGLKFIGAECVAPPHRLGDLGWPKASMELATLPQGIN